MAGRLRDQFAALERAMRDWELVDSDRFSFEDSDRFEEDSLCSWISEPESLCNNWRGWKKSTFAPNGNPVQNNLNGSAIKDCSNNSNNSVAGGAGAGGALSHAASSSNLRKVDFPLAGSSSSGSSQQLSLVELAAKLVASHIPFEMVERFYPPVPEQLQLRIAFWSFPEHEEDIRLYSCLANGSAEEFQKGERLFRNDSVSDILQIGFHLSATVKPNMREAHKVAVTFDRRRVTSCTCTCNASTNWCGHVVAVCLHRIFQSKDVMLRAPVSESLSRLHRDQLQKFAQYLISELPQQILPTAQRLLDELLSSQRSAINTLRGAPDPTAGASANEQTTWYLDERTLHGNIHKILIKFCVPAPIVFSDVNYLSSAAPPASAEWSSLLRPLRGREPEGMWNLLSIVREMFRREDRNAIPLLEIITEECLNCDQILVWWFNTKVALHNGSSGHGGKHHSVNSNAHACQHAGASLCDEIVQLWRLAALNPGISPDERCILHSQFKEWHLKIIEKVSKSRNASVGSKHANSFKNDVEVFPGFKPAMEACYLNWDNYPIPGVTYSESNRIYHCPFMCFRHSDGHSRSGDTGMIHSSHAVLNNQIGEHHLLHSSATISSIPIGLASKRPRSVEFGADKVTSTSSSTATAGPSGTTAAAVPGPSSSSATSTSKSSGKSGKGSKKHREQQQQQREAMALTVNMEVLESFSPVLPVGASGLKIKSSSSRHPSIEQSSSSFDDEIPGPSPSSSAVAGSSTAAATTTTSRIVTHQTVPSNPLTSSSTGSTGESSADGSSSSSGSHDGAVVVVVERRDGNRSSVSSEGFCENEEVEVDSELLRDEGVELAESKLEQINNKTTTTTTSDEQEVDGDADSDSSASARACAVLVPAIVPSAPPPKSDSSDSQQSGDEYQLYYYDAKTPVSAPKRENGKAEDKKDTLGFNVIANLKRMEDPWEILFARAEGLHAHGHSKDACVLGVKLADELLANPPDLTLEPPPTAPTGGKGKKRKVNPASHQISCLASATLAKCGFLCTVLAENPEYYYLAFQVGMFGLELARPPASTKPLEVKLANQEAELAQLLKRIAIGAKELNMIREKAENLRDGKFKSRGDALLPLVLANFIFDALVMPTNREGRCLLQPGVYHLPTDETLGFEAAVAALGLKANVSEAEHPLLCEGTRRQRGDLALAMLLHYKDDPEKLAKVMDKLLDREIHQLYKAPLPAAYYSNNPPTTTLLGTTWANRNEERDLSPSGNSSALHPLSNNCAGNSPNSSPPPASSSSAGASASAGDAPSGSNGSNEAEAEAINSEVDSLATLLRSASVGSKGSNGSGKVPASSNGNSSASPGNGGSSSSPSSSPPSSGTPGVATSSSSATASAAAPSGTAAAQTNAPATSSSSSTGPNGSSKPGRESGRFKGKRNYPVLPNQPSEAGAHFMFELAKIVLGKAGGSSNQSLFTQPSNNGQNPRGPHRALHMCAFHIGLYALGLHNAVSPNWLSRTYSSHVSWITGQAMEIGAPAIAFLIDTWDSHLTPPEAVTIADRASRGDVNMVRAAAELALSCLPHAHALNPNEIHRAILQCKEQSDGMLEKACITVESAAKGGGVYPEVLFDVARQWYSLYQKHLPLDADILNEELSHQDSLLSLENGNMESMGTHVSMQTGLPPVNPNNPPPQPPSVSSAGPTGPMEMIGMGPPGPPMSHGHQPVYPIATHQGVPVASIPAYAAAAGPYGQVPQFIPAAAFNPVPGNFVYGQTVIYQASASNNPGVATTTAGYFNQGGQQSQPQNGGFGQAPPLHQQPQLHNMVSAGPALQYYPSVTSITSAGLRPTAQFFPVSHMSLHPAHAAAAAAAANSLNSIPPTNSNVAAVMAAAAAANGHPHPHAAGHAAALNAAMAAAAGQGHLVAISSGGGGGGGGAGGNGPSMAIAGVNNGPHGNSHPHSISINAGRPPVQPQVSCGSSLVPHSGFVQSGPLVSQPSNVVSQHVPGLGGSGMLDNGANSAASAAQGRGVFPQGGRDHGNQQGGPAASAVKLKYLLAAYRVGMLAMETLARRVHDDRPAAKFARNPPYGEDVKWLLGISRKLGAQYLQQFCICAVSSIANPFVLHEIILDAALISTRNNLAWVYQNPRSPLAPLVQKCQQMYFQCLHQKLYHITLSDYEDFVNIVCTARQAFYLTPDGISQFKEWLQNIRRSKACKKDLWAQITAALQANQK